MNPRQQSGTSLRSLFRILNQLCYHDHRKLVTNLAHVMTWLSLIGFMLATAFLSMWISNTAACAMMIPILDAILEEVLSVNPDVEGQAPAKSEGQPPAKGGMRSMLCMSVALASNIGGTATTIGTTPVEHFLIVYQ